MIPRLTLEDLEALLELLVSGTRPSDDHISAIEGTLEHLISYEKSLSTRTGVE